MNALRRLGFALWLAFALALGQQAAALHGLSHATDQVRKDDSKPGSSTCDQCGLFAELASALGSTAPVAPFLAASPPRAEFIRERDAALPPRFAFRSRAPPVSLA